MVDRLEQAGFLQRERAKDDRRVVHLHLKAGARQNLMASMLAAHVEVGGMFEDLTSSDIEQLVGLLERLRSDS